MPVFCQLTSDYELKSENRQLEDAALKTCMQFFADELLPFFGIHGQVKSIAPTELVHLDISKLFQDLNLIMEDGTWKHFEFQSTHEGLDGLKRFRVYESMTSYQNKVPVTMCSIMGETMSQIERTKAAYMITSVATDIDAEIIRKVQAVIYAMADKFLESDDLSELRKVISILSDIRVKMSRVRFIIDTVLFL